MEITVVTPPEQEPVPLDEARDYLRVTSTAEDTLIEQLVTAARQRVEMTTGYALGVQTRRLVLDRWTADGVVVLPSPPLISVVKVESARTDGTFATLAEGEGYDVLPGEPGAICLRGAVPASLGRPGSVRIEFTCGLGGDAEGAAPIPSNLLVAIKSLVLHWFDHRSPVEGGQVTSVPNSYDFRTASHRFRYRIPS